jgi:hypothetical protein
MYCLDINGLPAGTVEVKSRHETRVHTGVLRLQLSSSTFVQLHKPGEAKPFFTHYGAKDVGLPLGDIEVEVAGQRELVSIEKDKVKEF